MRQIVTKRYRDVRAEIASGDLLLFRFSSFVGRAIQAAGRGQYSHAGMAVRCEEYNLLLCCEMREFVGGRAVTLSSQVQRFSGFIDVFKANLPEYNGHGAARVMMRKAGCDYGYAALWASAMLHLPVIRWFRRPAFDDSLRESWLPDYCSAAVAHAARAGGGVDAVPELGDKWTDPNDLARSVLWKYGFTLLA